MEKSAIIIFQKNAELGKVKTRLANDLGDQTALKIYDRLCALTHHICSQVPVDKFLYYSNFLPEDKPRYASYHFKVQTGIGLGARMSNAFSDIFYAGYQKILIIGTDCAEISPDLFFGGFRDTESAGCGDRSGRRRWLLSARYESVLSSAFPRYKLEYL